VDLLPDLNRCESSGTDSGGGGGQGPDGKPRVTYNPTDIEAAGLNIVYLAVLSVVYLVAAVVIDYMTANPWLRMRLASKSRKTFTSQQALVRVRRAHWLRCVFVKGE
jgi:hypothetical protein